MSFPVSFPSAIDSLDTLLEAKNNQIFSLASDISASSTSLVVSEVITNAPDKGFITIDNEYIEYHSKTNATKTFGGLVRGADGSTATSHSAGSNNVKITNNARYRQILVDLGLAFLRKIGIVSASEPSYDGGNEVGDKWIDTSGATPTLKMWTGSAFTSISGGGGAVEQYIPSVSNEALSAGVLKTVSFSGAGNAAVPEVGKVIKIKVNKNGGGTVANPIYMRFYKSDTINEANAVSGDLIFDLTVADDDGDYIAFMLEGDAFAYDLGVGNSTLYARVICATAFNIDIELTIEEQSRGA